MGPFLFELALVHLLAGSLLVIAAMLLLRARPALNARTRHDVWLLVLLLLVLMPLLALVPGRDPAAGDPATPPRATQSPPPAAVPGLRAPAGDPARDRNSGRDDQQNLRPAEASPALQALIAVLPLLYVAGVLLGALRLALAWRRARELYAGSLPAPAPAHATLRRLAPQLGLRRLPELRCSRAVEAPMTAGLLHPWIALPAQWVGNDRSELLEHALAHELAHVLRRDPLAALFARVASTVFFYHPGVSYACHRLEEERESVCDDQVIRLTGGTRRYAESLVLVAEALVTRVNPVLAVGCLHSKRQLRRRITHMLDRNSNHSTRTRWPLLALAGLAATLSLLATRPAWPEPPRLVLDLTALATTLATGVHPDGHAVHPEEGLLYAAWSGDLAAAERLLEAGADPDEIHRRGGSPRTALVAAAGRGHSELVALLLAHGADVNLVAPRDGSALMAALAGGHDAIAVALLEEGADPDVRIRGDGSPLITAARTGNVRLVEALLARGADPDAAVRGDGSPLIAAARSGDLATVDALLEAGADPDRYVRGDEAPLFHAVVDGDVAIVRRLLAGGADPNVRYDGDGTPLMLALRHGHGDVSDLLIEAGADTEAAVRGDGNALIAAGRAGDAQAVRRLLALGADPDAAVDGDGSALINAASRGDLELVALLLEAGADVNQAVPGDDTPLINAVRADDARIVTLLLEAGADPQQPGDEDHHLGTRRTPVNQAHSPAILELLREAGPR